MKLSRTQRLKNWWHRSLHGYSTPEQDPLINTAYRHYGIRPSAHHVPAKWWGKAFLFIAAKKKYAAALLTLLGLISVWAPAIPEQVDKITREWLGWFSNEPQAMDHVVTPKSK